jgi:hypothetical protein
MDGQATSHPVIRRGEGHRRYTARGSVMFFKAVAEQDDGDLSLMERTMHDLWNRDEAPTHDEERTLMARFGTETG